MRGYTRFLHFISFFRANDFYFPPGTMLCNYIFAAWHVFILHITQPYSLLILYRMKPKRRTIIHTKEHARRQKCNCIGLFPYGKVHKSVGGGRVFRQRYRRRRRSAACSMPTPTHLWTSVTCSSISTPESSPPPGELEGRTQKQRGVILIGQLLSLKTAATYSPTNAVPSARSGLTSLFGMGRGGTPTL